MKLILLFLIAVLLVGSVPIVGVVSSAPTGTALAAPQELMDCCDGGGHLGRLCCWVLDIIEDW